MMTYIERHGWCSSSISSTMYPTNVDKSRGPCPILSSSHASTSLISNSDSIPISTDSISSSSFSYGKRKKTSTFNARSSIGYTDDYYTSKRIDELHERMDDIQISSFLKFINYHLSLNKDKEVIHIDDLIKDLSNGHVLIDLIEILSSTKLKREHGHTRFHSLTNVQYVLDYLKSRMQYINISPHDIVSGNRKQILALLWIIMKTFDFPGFRITNKHCFAENTLLGFGQDRSVTIKWLNNILNHSLNTQQNYIQDFYLQTWINGYYLSLIMKYLIPLSKKYLTTKCFDYLKELNNSYDKQRFSLCLNLSNYCFNTITIIDYTDKSEKCLFKFFTELQQNILIILKTNQIGKLIQNNPYTKQILDTVIQTTTEHSSHIINDNEQYLTCIEDDNQQISTGKHTRLSLNSLGQSTSSSDDMEESVEKSRLFDNEEQKKKLKRINRWETIESKSHVINGHDKTSNDEHVKVIVKKPQQINGIDKKSEQPSLTVEKIEQNTNCHIKPAEPTVANQDLEQFTLTVEQPVVADEEVEQIIVADTENQLTDKLESIISNEQNKPFVNGYQKDIQQPVANKNYTPADDKLEQSIPTAEEQSPSVVSDEKLEPIATEEPQQLTTPNEENKKSEETEVSSEKIEQSPVEVEEQKQLFTSNQQAEPLEETASIVTENESPANNDLDKIQEPITFNEENNTSTVEYETLAEPVESKPSIISNETLEKVTIEEILQPVILNQEAVITPVENENLEQPTIEVSPSSVILNQECEQKPNKIIENEPFITSNGKLEQPIIVHEETDHSSTPVKQVEQDIKNKPSNILNKKLEQPTMTLVENNPSIVTSKKLEKPLVLNGTTNKPTNSNKKSIANTKKPTQTASSNEQVTLSSAAVKEPEQQKVAAISTKDINSPETVNKESVQATASVKKQEKKKIVSPIISTETLKQDTQQISITSAITDLKQSEVSLEKQEPPSTIMEETSVSAIPNGETKKSSNKNKKSKRSNAKKGKAKNSPTKVESSQQLTINHEVEEDEEEEKIESSLPSLNLTTTVPEQKPTIIESEVQTLSTTPKIPFHETTSMEPENSQNSSALRSRKTKKKKATISTTTIIEKSSSPISPILPTNRNLFVIIKESIRDRKIIAFKCVFILVCLCFSIIIIVLSHK